MKFSAVVSALVIASASAFAPAAPERASTSLNLDRRSAMGAIVAAGLVAVPAMASADGSVSAATVQRSKFNYGNRIADLKSAVDAGDFGAVAAEKNAFILFNSGAYPRVKSKPKKAAAIAGTNAIFAAIRAEDKAALKSAYGDYCTANDIKAFEVLSANEGQGYSNDYDYRRGTKLGAIYQR